MTKQILPTIQASNRMFVAFVLALLGLGAISDTVLRAYKNFNPSNS